MTRGTFAGLVVVLALCPGAGTAKAQEVSLAGTLRNYNLLRLRDAVAVPAARRDVNLLNARAMPTVAFNGAFTVEGHLVLDVLAPSQGSVVGLSTGRSGSFLPLTRTVADGRDARVTGRVDRLHAHLHTPTVDLTVGRQAVTWGVNTLFPALDMFSPFAPTQIDRDYKTGVDAVRLRVAAGAHVGIDAVAAQLGARRTDAAAVGVLVHVNAGAIDIGALAGAFHRDALAGTFATLSVAGTVLRAEASRTVPGLETDRLRRPSFWRAGVGLDRQLTATLNLSTEIAYNGFGERQADAYPAVLATARLLRGEIAGPGMWAAGGTLGWHFHPLATLSTLGLVNLNDRSAAAIPVVTWSVSNRAELLSGAQMFIGRAPSSPVTPRSEYGGLGSTGFAGLKLYF